MARAVAALFVAMLVVAAAAPAASMAIAVEDLESEESLWDLYERWYTLHEVARDPGEKLRRFSVFKQNVGFIYEFNRRGPLTKLGLNIFADLDEVELSDLDDTGCQWPSNPPTATATGLNQSKIPDMMDWREKKAVTSVKEQGKCGACWAFASVGAVESLAAIRTNVLEDLSPQMLVDCDARNNGCKGGSPLKALDYIQFLGGAATERAYPYTGKKQRCRLRYTDRSLYASIDGFTLVTPNDECWPRSDNTFVGTLHAEYFPT